MIVSKLTRQGRKQKEGEDEQRLRNGAELELFVRVRIELIGHEQHDRLFEKAVVERAEELCREQGNEAPRAQQVGNVLDQSRDALGFIGPREA